MHKLEKAVDETGINRVAIAGGVSANSALRQAMEERRDRLGWETFIPRFEYCTDNAGMIGITGYYKFLRGEFTDQAVVAKARMDF